MAVAVELLWRRFSWAGNAVLLSTYALAPLVHVAMVALLLEVPARPMRARVITRPLPRPVYRLAQWLLVYSLLSPAIVTAVVNFVRIGYLNAPPAPGQLPSCAVGHAPQQPVQHARLSHPRRGVGRGGASRPAHVASPEARAGGAAGFQ